MNLLIKENARKTKVHDPVVMNGVFPVPLDLCQRVLRGKVVNGKPVGELSPLYPESQFRDFCLDATKRWLHDMDLRGYEPHTPPDQIRVYGPYPPHDWGGVARESAMRAVGYRADEIFDFGVLDFRLRGLFVATKRLINEVDYERALKRETSLLLPHNYILGGKGRPGLREDDEVLKLLAERELLIEEAKRRPAAKR